MSVGARPDRRYDAEDTALIHFSYDSGLYGSLLLSRFIGPKTEEIRLVGSEGVVHLERGRIRRLTNSGEVIESLHREQAWPSAAACQIDYFQRVINGTRPNLSGPAENLTHMAFVAACYEAARTHIPLNPKEGTAPALVDSSQPNSGQSLSSFKKTLVGCSRLLAMAYSCG